MKDIEGTVSISLRDYNRLIKESEQIEKVKQLTKNLEIVYYNEIPPMIGHKEPHEVSRLLATIKKIVD